MTIKETPEMTKHTPLPWVEDSAFDGKPIIFAPGHHVICQMAYERGENDYGAFDNHQANAEFICRAVNSHYELLEALKKLANALGDTDPYVSECLEQAFSAITKAEGTLS